MQVGDVRGSVYGRATLTTTYKSKGDETWNTRKDMMRARTVKGRGGRENGDEIVRDLAESTDRAGL